MQAVGRPGAGAGSAGGGADSVGRRPGGDLRGRPDRASTRGSRASGCISRRRSSSARSWCAPIAGTGSARVAVSSLGAARDAVAAASGLARRRDGAAGGARRAHVTGGAVTGNGPYGMAGRRTSAGRPGCGSDATWPGTPGRGRPRRRGSWSWPAAAGGTAAGVLTAADHGAGRGDERRAALLRGRDRGGLLADRAGLARPRPTSLISGATQRARRRGAGGDRDQPGGGEPGRSSPVPDGVHDVVFGGLATGELIGFVPDFGFTGAGRRGRDRPGGDPARTRSWPRRISPWPTTRQPRSGLPFPFDYEGTPKQQGRADRGWPCRRRRSVTWHPRRRPAGSPPGTRTLPASRRPHPKPPT